MCTASHNPKAYTGAKLVKQGAIALSGDDGIQDIRRRIEDGLGEPAGRRLASRRSTIYDGVPGRRAAVHRPGERQAAEGRRRRRQRHGRARWSARCSSSSASTSSRPTGRPTASSPTTSPTRCCPRTASSSCARSSRSGADLGIAWDGDADRCFFIDDTGAFVDGDFLTAMLAEYLLRKTPGEAILYDVRASRAVADTVDAAGGTRAPQPRRPRVLQDAHARRGRDLRRRGLRPLLLPRLLLRRQRHDPGAADPRAAVASRAASCPSCSATTARRTSSPARSTRPSTTRPAKIAEIEERYADARIGHLDGVSVDYDDWHFNVRTSNTEPLLRLCLESLVSREDMERRRDEVLGIIRS